MTNKRDWDTFVRSKQRFRVYEYSQSNKLECFNLWLDSDKSWDAIKLHVDRIHQQENCSKRGWVSVQGRDIRAKYPEDKANQLIASRKQEGLYYEDPDFPGDDDETSPNWNIFQYICIYTYGYRITYPIQICTYSGCFLPLATWCILICW